MHDDRPPRIVSSKHTTGAEAEYVPPHRSGRSGVRRRGLGGARCPRLGGEDVAAGGRAGGICGQLAQHPRLPASRRTRLRRRRWPCGLRLRLRRRRRKEGLRRLWRSW
ncbi:hypothetical protein DAI22_05g173800 [Oryza sativa Japonica Group]|nr:hypothetical protein DAI22_05g173800 [Oryza sativa Japonica Group]